MKNFFIVSTLVLVVLIIPVKTFALYLGSDIAKNTATQAGFSGNTTQTTFSETLGSVVKTILSFVGVIFISLMVYAGFLWMTARGDEGKIETSQNIIRSSIIGLIITMGAYSITAFVLPRILSKTTGDNGGSATLGGVSVSGRCEWRVASAADSSGRVIYTPQSRDNVNGESVCQAICRDQIPPTGGSIIDCQFVPS
jgi:hypothetical protein